MSMIPQCVVCDRPVANPYAPDARCERCKEPCRTCGGDVQRCTHPLGEPYSELKRTGTGGWL